MGRRDPCAGEYDPQLVDTVPGSSRTESRPRRIDARNRYETAKKMRATERSTSTSADCTTRTDTRR